MLSIGTLLALGAAALILRRAYYVVHTFRVSVIFAVACNLSCMQLTVAGDSRRPNILVPHRPFVTMADAVSNDMVEPDSDACLGSHESWVQCRP